MNKYLNRTALAVIMASGIVACGDDDPDDPVDMGTTPADMGNDPVDGGVMPMADCATATQITCAAGNCVVPAGEYTGATEFMAANVYELCGRVFIGDAMGTPSSITIEAGTKIESARAGDETGAYLAVLPGATIDANGTAMNPIVFTSKEAAPDRQDWGGVIISGNATVNCGGMGTTCVGEGDTGSYGGMADDDNSGTMRYVRIEFGGKKINATDELNGLALQGVGSGTTLDYIHVHKSGDDGFEFFGGTVDAKHIIATGIGDDSFDWTFGWRGRVQYAIAQQHADAGDQGIEADNNEDDDPAQPRSNPIWSNMTLIGSPDSTSSDIGILLREGTGGQIWNTVVFAFNEFGLDIDDAETFNNANATAGNLAIANSVMCNATNFKDDMDDVFAASAFFTDSTAFPGNVGNMAIDTFPTCNLGIGTDATNETAPNFTPDMSSMLGSGGQVPTSADNFFDTVTFRGAVEPGMQGAAGGAWWTWTSFP